MFRLFFKLSFFGRFLADICLAVFLICLFFPILPALGILNPVTTIKFQPTYFVELIQKPILLDIVIALTLSFFISFLMILTGLVCGYLSHSSYTAKFIALSTVSLFLFIPDSIHFLLGVPFLSLLKITNLYALTYLSSFSWGFALSLLAAYSFMSGIRKAELQILELLGANHLQIIFEYLIPKAKSYIIYGGFALGFFLSLQGLYTFQQVKGSKSLLFYHLVSSQDFFGDPGQGAAVYAVLLLFALTGCILTTKYANIEFNTAINSIKQHRKKVRRRIPKELKKKVKKEKKSNVTPNLPDEKVDTESIDQIESGISSEVQVSEIVKEEESPQISDTEEASNLEIGK